MTNKTKITIGPITLNVWNDYYGAPNRLSPTRAEAADICKAENASMITVPVAKAIFNQSSLKVGASPLGSGSQKDMRSKLQHHNDLINAKIPVGFSGLVAGHMKDLVLSEKLYASKKVHTTDPSPNIVIWGWLKSLKPLAFWQGEFGNHYAGWADYSQGLRLVDRACEVGGQPKDLHDLYKDINFSVYLTVSGQPLKRVTYE